MWFNAISSEASALRCSRFSGFRPILVVGS
jgi:hypothetical protein